MIKSTRSITLFILALLSTAISSLFSAKVMAENSSRPDSHAPISIMGDHLHDKGEWMLSYRYMTMQMNDNYVNSNEVSNADVLQDFMVTPDSMDMDMHMLGAMYAPTDDVTLIAMAKFLSSSMDHETRMGMRFTTETSGLSDLQLGALIKIDQSHQSSSHLNLGLSVPTGSIEERDQTPAGYNRLPYPMQLGSGTYDVQVGATHTQFFDQSSWGVQAKQLFRTGYNKFDYRLGNRFNLNSWFAYNMSQDLSLNATIGYTNQKDIKGSDSALNPMMIPTARTDLRSGYFWDLGIGANIKLNAHHRLALDITKTLHQKLDGPQLGRDWNATIGWQYSL